MVLSSSAWDFMSGGVGALSVGSVAVLVGVSWAGSGVAFSGV